MNRVPENLQEQMRRSRFKALSNELAAIPPLFSSEEEIFAVAKRLIAQVDDNKYPVTLRIERQVIPDTCAGYGLHDLLTAIHAAWSDSGRRGSLNVTFFECHLHRILLAETHEGSFEFSIHCDSCVLDGIESWAGAVHGMVQIHDSLIKGGFSVGATRFNGGLSLQGTIFEGGVTFHDMKDGPASVDRAFDLSRIVADQEFSLAGATFSTPVLVDGAVFRGSFRCSGAKFLHPAIILNCQFRRDCSFSGALFADRIAFLSCVLSTAADFRNIRAFGESHYLDGRWALFEGARATMDAPLDIEDRIRLRWWNPLRGSYKELDQYLSLKREAERLEQMGRRKLRLSRAFRKWLGLAATVQGRFQRKDRRWIVERRNELEEMVLEWKYRKILEPQVRSEKRAVGARRINWGAVRAVGELALLTRASYLALLFVPILAGLWTALRAALVRSLRGWEEMSVAVQAMGSRSQGSLCELESTSLEQLQAFFATAWLPDAMLPDSWAAAFFAALCVVSGHLVYQLKAPQTIKEWDRAEFGRLKAGDRAMDRLIVLAELSEAMTHLKNVSKAYSARRSQNFISRHGRIVWVPSRLCWYSDQSEPDPARHLLSEWARQLGDPDFDDEAALPEDGSFGASLVKDAPNGERVRIAIEEGAMAFWDLEAARNHTSAKWSWRLYVTALVLIAIIVFIQAIHIADAAGWLPRFV